MKFIVEGMTCSHCVRAITQAVEPIAPGSAVFVDLAAKTVRVDDGADASAVAAAIEAAGYTVAATEANESKPSASDAGSCCGGCSA